MNGNNNINNHEGGGRRVFVRNNSQSQIPLPRFTTMTTLKMGANNNGTTMSENGDGDKPWKAMYEEAERKRKILVTQSQRNARDYAEMERKQQLLIDSNAMVQQQLHEKTLSLAELRRVSEAMYKEYDQLKNKYEVETGALHEAMKSAHQWYKQNRMLKRQSTMLAQKFLTLSPGGAIDIDLSEDSVDAEDREGEMEDLRKSVRNLSEEVGRLQSELNSARLEEFEAQEQAMNHATELEAERVARKQAEAELEDLRAMRDNVNAVSHMVATELVALRSQCQQEQEVAKAFKIQADQAQKERNVLAHQSTMLMGDFHLDDRIMMLLQEVENLKRALEEEQQRHASGLKELQEKLEERENEAQLELMEEKLKLAESELQCALHRAERAETQTDQLSKTVSRLEVELIAKAAPPPPPPPPPPPLPPPLPNLAPTPRQVPNAVVDMAKMLGVVHKQTTATVQGGAIDDIINQIKGGRFNLKTTDKSRGRKEEAPPPAVQEMLTILGTMKRRPRVQPAPADIAL